MKAKAKAKGAKAKSKKSNKSSTRGDSESNLSKNSHVKTGTDTFGFPNGDCYVGEYRATFARNICRQGKGLYYTADDQSYKGIWEDDVLNGEVKITFPEKSFYSGQMSNFSYSGQGNYVFPNGAKLNCAFVKDLPTEEVVMEDPSGHQWHGTAERTGVILKPQNHYLLGVKERLDAIEQARMESLIRMSSDVPREKTSELRKRSGEKQNNTSKSSLRRSKTNSLGSAPSGASKSSLRKIKPKSLDSVESGNRKSSPRKNKKE